MLAALSPRNLFRAALDVELSSAATLARVAPTDDDRLRWVEHRNRLHVFRLFQYADDVLGTRGGSDISAAVLAARDLSPFDRPWAIEGVAYAWAHGRTPRDIHRRLSGMRLPAWSVIPVHTGAGLSVATRLLPDVDATIDACDALAEPGFASMAVEAAGLAARNLSPRQVPAIDARLARWGGPLRACFWHGVGRGTYFAPSSWSRTSESAAAAFDRLWGLAPDESAGDCALVGFGWAATLVNLHSPEVLEDYLTRLTDPRDAWRVAEGLYAALLAWQYMAPDDEAIDGLLSYEPLDADAWDALVSGPARAARDRFPALRCEQRVPDPFFGAWR
jgi:hypothetical protein